MWGWTKRSGSTGTPLRKLLEQQLEQNRILTDDLAAALKASNEREARLVGCLDRIVGAKYDPPQTLPVRVTQPDNGMRMAPEHWADVLAVEDDGEFLRAVHGDTGETNDADPASE